MYSFSDVIYNAEAETATIGTGLVWDTVYSTLEAYGVNVVGGKATGVGVGGYTLGGGKFSQLLNSVGDATADPLTGYSYLSNQYGLGVDNVLELELVMPNGTVATINSVSEPDLFFGLRVSS
jgi:FAD/FMN-containing dehydrogenase